MDSKIGIKKIKLTRTEGPTKLCDIEHSVDSFSEADSWLFKSSCQNAGEEGYDKHVVVFIWADGTEMQCRFDVKHPNSSGFKDVSTTEHLLSFAEYFVKDEGSVDSQAFAERLLNELATSD